MFQSAESAAGSNHAGAADHRGGGVDKFWLPSASALDASFLTALAGTLAELGGQPLPDTEAIDCIRALEELKCAAAAAQARVSAVFDASQRREQAALGATAEEQGKGIGGQLALARRESPARGSRHLGFAKALVFEMPHTLNALTAGKLSEWRATLLVRETACLSVEARATVDREVAADPQALERLSDRALISAARKAAYRLDPQSVVRRAAKAIGERNVTCRPAPDTMAYLTALLPAAQAVAVLAALTRAADGARATGDARGRGQIMADTLVERATGAAQADKVNLEVQLVMTDKTLLAGDAEPAYLPGYGIIPAQTARDLARQAASAEDAWIRRLYAAPATGQLMAMDSRARFFPKGLAHFIAVRDQLCATPWCDAPIRHTDHILGRAAGGQTTDKNGRGLCEACNYTKEAPGWSVRADPDPPADDPHRPRQAGAGGSTTTTTPTGHTYRSTPPALPGSRPDTA